MNGRLRGDSPGRLTFHGKSGVSVADYAICDRDLFHSIANFIRAVEFIRSQSHNNMA